MRIVTVNSPKAAILRRKAKPARRVTSEVVRLMDEMVEVMRREAGVGLAAPQVGLSLRVIVVEYEGKLFQLADPEITFREGREVAQEGCLSLPKVLCDVALGDPGGGQGEEPEGTGARGAGGGLAGPHLPA